MGLRRLGNPVCDGVGLLGTGSCNDPEVAVPEKNKDRHWKIKQEQAL